MHLNRVVFIFLYYRRIHFHSTLYEAHQIQIVRLKNALCCKNVCTSTPADLVGKSMARMLHIHFFLHSFFALHNVHNTYITLTKMRNKFVSIWMGKKASFQSVFHLHRFHKNMRTFSPYMWNRKFNAQCVWDAAAAMHKSMRYVWKWWAHRQNMPSEPIPQHCVN